MTVKDYKEIFRQLNPVYVSYNGEIIFDDDDIELLDKDYTKMLEEYDEFMNSDKNVSHFEATVVHFHHTLLDIVG